MANANKIKGDKYEREILAQCHRAGFLGATRTRPGRNEDQGDILLNRAGTAIIQTKDVAQLNFRDWMAELDAQMDAAGAGHGALVVKRRGVGGRPALHLAVMDVEMMLDLMARAGHQDGPTR
ncbi:hypothetical protein [Gordonia terrae]